MGYLVLEEDRTVTFQDGTRRTFRKGVNKDVTREEADHWYLKGTTYVDKLEDAHKKTPEAMRTVGAARAEWEQAQRGAMLAAISAESLRKDLETLEKEFGVNTRDLDKQFRSTLKDEEERMEALQASAEQRAADQVAQEEEAATALSPAEAERKAAGSEEVANTQMDGPAKVDAEKTAADTAATITSGATTQAGVATPTATELTPSTKEEVKAAGSAETANTQTDKALDGKAPGSEETKTPATEADKAKAAPAPAAKDAPKK